MRICTRRLRAWGKLLLCVLLLGWAFIWIYRNKQRLLIAFNFQYESFTLLLILAFFSFLVIGLANQLFITHLGARLKFIQWASLSFTSSLANLIFPLRAGAFFRARYLKKNFTLPYSAFISTQAAFMTMNLMANCIAGIGSLLWLYILDKPAPPSVVIFFLAATACCLGILILIPSTSTFPARKRWGEFLRLVQEGWHQLRSDPGLMLKTSTLTLVLIIISVLRLYIAFRSIGHPLMPAGCILAASLAGIGTLLALTPSGLGIKEAAIVYIGMSLHLPPEVGVLAAVMDRAVGIIILLVFGTIGFGYLSHDESFKKKL